MFDKELLFEARQALEDALPRLEHNADTTPEGHRCGAPSSYCDQNCATAAHDSAHDSALICRLRNLLDRLRRL